MTVEAIMSRLDPEEKLQFSELVDQYNKAVAENDPERHQLGNKLAQTIQVIGSRKPYSPPVADLLKSEQPKKWWERWQDKLSKILKGGEGK
ncbi:hypothetical protein [Peribacillus loiseleuriae]|uniref:hypothetical protein n=1 Tax=Peribacillus loiseleuriae TaxID=1679170 RepID=UPI003D03B3B7